MTNLRIESNLFISHIRWSGGPSTEYVNTHPFYRKVRGKTWMLAHHGIGVRFRDLQCTGQFVPMGETASERIFCHLLEWINSKPILSPSDFFEELATKLHEINLKGKMNLLFSDGHFLFAYHGRPPHKNLYYLNRRPPYHSIRLKDEDITVDLGKTKNSRRRGWIVASRPLTDEEWKLMEPGQLMVFRSGERVFEQA